MTRHRLIYVPSASTPSITIGRKNSVSVTGSGGNFTIGWSSGGAAANGTWLVAVIGEVQAATPPLISGGSTWTRLGTTNCYYKQCGPSEPTTYTVQYIGAAKPDGTAVTICEILGASAVDATASVTSSSTSPSVTSSAASDAIVVAMRNSSAAATITPPSGYTLQSSISGNAASAIATKLNVGSGSISPGAWNTSFSALHTLAFKV